MGRTFEVLGGRVRKANGAESAPVPIPAPEPAEPTGPVLVPMTQDDLPADDDGVPHVEVGGPRTKTPAGPQLLPPRTVSPIAAPEVVFQLLPNEIRPAAGPPSADLIAYHRPDHPAARQYRLLADGIAAQHPAARPPVLLFTSTSARTAGTSTVANLAVTRASDGYGRVLVVEAERGPGSSAERFGVPTVPGVRELLARGVPLTLAIHRTAVEGVYLMPAGKATVGTDEMARLPAILDQLRARYDWILIDAPPWGTYALNDWVAASDSVYLVIRPDEWDSPHADVAHEGIARAGGRLRGCVTTQEVPAARPAQLADDHGNGDQVVDHVGAAVGVARRRLRAPLVIRRPGDE
jgi:Mrp family chromosome partitioning ATPase